MATKPTTKASNPAAAPKRRAYASNVLINIDSFINIRVDLVSARPSDKHEFKMLCGNCEELHTVSERFICKDTDTVFEKDALKRGREIDKVFYEVTEEQIEEVKALWIDPEQPLSIRVFPAVDVNAAMRPTGTSYLLRPQGASEKAYVAFAQAVADPKLAFLIEVALRGNQKVYRVEGWNGQLVLQEMIRPNELAATEPVLADVSKAEVTGMKQLVMAKVEKFKATDFDNQIPARVAKLDEALLTAPVKKPAKKAAAKKTNSTDDLMAALQGAIEAKKKKTPKKTKAA